VLLRKKTGEQRITFRCGKSGSFAFACELIVTPGWALAGERVIF
jgi:hypothetical protein